MKNIELSIITIVVCAVLFSVSIMSCGNDDEKEEYTSFIIGTWDTGEVSPLTDLPTGNTGIFSYTFNSDGTGFMAKKSDGTVYEQFKYTIVNLAEDNNGLFDFIIKYTAYNNDGNVEYSEQLGGKRIGSKGWNLYSDGGRLLHVMNKETGIANRYLSMNFKDTNRKSVNNIKKLQKI